VVAEVAQAHDGSLGAAHAYIDAVALTGAQAIKFQTHFAAEESTVEEPWRVRFSKQDATRYDYWKRMEFNEDQWAGLAKHAREKGLIFLSSPFSLRAVALLESLGIPAWKIASGEVSNPQLLDRVASTGKPVLLSSGLSGWDELDAAVARVRRAGAPIAVLQATTAYPCPPERLGLNLVDELRRRYRCPVGLSDHSATIYAGLAAVAMGAHLLEVHVVFSRDCFGPDTGASLTLSELADLVRGTQFLHRALVHPLDKEKEAASQAEIKRLFSKSVVAARNLHAGELLTDVDLALKKPGTGIPAARMCTVLGRRLVRDVPINSQIREDDLA
jgi:N-acetylneuraminate synthase